MNKILLNIIVFTSIFIEVCCGQELLVEKNKPNVKDVNEILDDDTIVIYANGAAGQMHRTYDEVNEFMHKHKEIQKVIIYTLLDDASMGEDFYKYLSTWEQVISFKHIFTTMLSDIRDKNFSYICLLTQLEEIHIYDVQLSNASYKKFVAFEKLKKLTLAKCNISDRNLRDIADMDNIQCSLQYLYFKGSDNISVKGIKELRKLKNLKFLSIMYCKKISTNDLRELQRALPGVYIQIYDVPTKEKAKKIQWGWG